MNFSGGKIKGNPLWHLKYLHVHVSSRKSPETCHYLLSIFTYCRYLLKSFDIRLLNHLVILSVVTDFAMQLNLVQHAYTLIVNY